MTVGRFKGLLTRTYSDWSDHDAPTLGAALSYYSVLSLAPLLVIAVSIAGMAFGRTTASGEVQRQLLALVGPSAADAIQTMLSHAQSPKAGILASAIGFGVLIFSASGVFSELRTALNRIWEIKPRQNAGWLATLRNQFFSFSMVVGIGFLLLVSLVVSAGLSALGKFVGNYVPAASIQLANLLISVVAITVFFALIYRVVPERTLPWRALWPGSFCTALLFNAGKYLLGLYLGKAGVGSAYGAAGSLVVILVWVYYSAQLFLFGAEFTRIYACEHAGVCLNAEARERHDFSRQNNEEPTEEPAYRSGR